MIEICVINLDRAEDRWAHISDQFNSLGMEVTRITGVDGKAGNHPLFIRYDDDLSRRWKGYSLTEGQLGCFASHYLAWQYCLQKGHAVIILEDDAVVGHDGLNAFLDVAKTLPAWVECIRLFRNHSRRYSVIPVQELGGGLQLVKYTKGAKRGTGYYLTPAGAKKFLENCETWFLPVDITMDRFWENGVECLGVLPPFISNDPAFESTIGYESTTEERASLVKLMREIYSIKHQVRRLTSNVIFWLKLRIFHKYY